MLVRRISPGAFSSQFGSLSKHIGLVAHAGIARRAALIGLCLLPWQSLQAKDLAPLDFGSLSLGSLLDLPIGLPKLEKKQLSTDYALDDEGLNLRAATLQSGMALTLNNPLMDFKLDYTLQGKVNKRNETERGDLNHILAGSFRSQQLDQLLKASAKVVADSRVVDDGDSYQHSVVSELRRPLRYLGTMTLSYGHDIERRSALTQPQYKTGFSADLDGQWLDGQLNWNTYYNNSRLTQNDTRRLVEEWKINSSYQLHRDMSFELGSGVKRESMVDNLDAEPQQQRRYTAGVSWSPLSDYSFELHFNRLDKTDEDRENFGSGGIVWTPQPLWRIELSYQDQLLPGEAGVMLSAELTRL